MKSQSLRLAALAGLLLIGSIGPASAQDNKGKHRSFTNSELRGTWAMSGWVEATLLVPFPGEITTSTPPSQMFGPGDKITVKGTLVGLFEFDGRGGIKAFQDLFKPGGVEPASPPFPIPYVPASPEQGYGTYNVDPNGMVTLSTLIVNPADDSVAGEADYNCVLSRWPRRLECAFARFKTYVVDPAGYDAPVAGLITLKPQR